MTFIAIGEIGCMSIPKCHWRAIVVNNSACWCGVVYAGSVSGIPTSSCDNHR